jgi:trehalose-6-phosphate synthase
MTDFEDLRSFFTDRNVRTIIAADAETVTHRKQNGNGLVEAMSAGGVSTALDPVARASNAVYISRAKTAEDMTVVDRRGNFNVETTQGDYALKRLAVEGKDLDDYYYGFSNGQRGRSSEFCLKKKKYLRACLTLTS